MLLIDKRDIAGWVLIDKTRKGDANETATKWSFGIRETGSLEMRAVTVSRANAWLRCKADG
jgi:hypothetical protein